MRLVGQRPDTAATHAFGAAGWLLAELTLILMVVFMGSLPGDSASSTPSGDISPPPTSETSGAPSSTASSTAKPGHHKGQDHVGLDINVQSFDIGVVMSGPGDRHAATKLLAWIKDHGGRPGLVLLFGVTYDSANGDGGSEVARDMASQLRRLGFNRRWPDAVVRPFLRLYSRGVTPPGQVTADVYYYQFRH